MNLKDTILTAWAAAKDEAERVDVLHQIGAAKHALLTEMLWAEPELRQAIWTLQGKLDTIMRCTLTSQPISAVVAFEHNEAPLVGLAGQIAMLLASRQRRQAQMHAELRGWVIHACRIHDASKARQYPARPNEAGVLYYVEPPNPLDVECVICRAKVGEKCIQPKVD